MVGHTRVGPTRPPPRTGSEPRDARAATTATGLVRPAAAPGGLADPSGVPARWRAAGRRWAGRCGAGRARHHRRPLSRPPPEPRPSRRADGRRPAHRRGHRPGRVRRAVPAAREGPARPRGPARVPDRGGDERVPLGVAAATDRPGLSAARTGPHPGRRRPGDAARRRPPDDRVPAVPDRPAAAGPGSAVLVGTHRARDRVGTQHLPWNGQVDRQPSADPAARADRGGVMTVEERLRGALNARAEQVTPDRLAPAAPPGASPSRRTLGPMIAAAAAAAVLTGGVVAGHGLIEAPAAPASPTRPAPTQPAVIVPTLPELGTPAPGLKQKQGTPLPK